MKTRKKSRGSYILLRLCIGLLLIFGAKRVSDIVMEHRLRKPLPDKAVPVVWDKIVDRGRLEEHRFTFEPRNGEHIPVVGSIPSGREEEWPAIVFLYGIGMRMQFSDVLAEAMTDAGFALFVMEQYGRGERRSARRSIIGEIAALRRRTVMTIQETRQLAEIIAAHPNIDAGRIYLWGASFGAITGSVAMAYDDRFKAGVLTAGAGDLYQLTKSPRLAREGHPVLMRGIAHILAELLRPFDPMRHVGAISPRPLLFQNALHDEYFPPETVHALHESAGQPKDVQWIDTSHSNPGRDAIEQIVLDGLAWLEKQDLTIRQDGLQRGTD